VSGEISLESRERRHLRAIRIEGAQEDESMRIRSRSLVAAFLGTALVACAHAPAPMEAQGGQRTAPPAQVVTGSHIRQRVDPSSGLPATTSPVRTYSRDQIIGTGRDGDLGAALRSLDPDLSR
jgi:hypothetical protein